MGSPGEQEGRITPGHSLSNPGGSPAPGKALPRNSATLRCWGVENPVWSMKGTSVLCGMFRPTCANQTVNPIYGIGSKKIRGRSKPSLANGLGRKNRQMHLRPRNCDVEKVSRAMITFRVFVRDLLGVEQIHEVGPVIVISSATKQYENILKLGAFHAVLRREWGVAL